MVTAPQQTMMMVSQLAAPKRRMTKFEGNSNRKYLCISVCLRLGIGTQGRRRGGRCCKLNLQKSFPIQSPFRQREQRQCWLWLIRHKRKRDTGRRGRGRRGDRSMGGDANRFVLSIFFLLLPMTLCRRESHVDSHSLLSRVVQQTCRRIASN
jgi:hypothetical protein